MEILDVSRDARSVKGSCPDRDRSTSSYGHLGHRLPGQLKVQTRVERHDLAAPLGQNRGCSAFWGEEGDKKAGHLPAIPLGDNGFAGNGVA